MDKSASPGKPGPAVASERVRPVPAVTRALAILRLLSRSEEPLGVTAIADQLGMVTSTCLHILRALVAEDMVKIDSATRRYSLGIGVVTLAKSALGRDTFPLQAQSALDRLSERWAVTAIGVEIVGIDHMVVVAISRAHAPFRLHVDIGSRFPALISATGRLVAAYADASRTLLEQRFRKLRWHHAPGFARWMEEVGRVRQRGYSLDEGDYLDGVTLIAVPVFDGSQRLTHALVAAELGDGGGRRSRQALIEAMREDARALSQASR